MKKTDPRVEEVLQLLQPLAHVRVAEVNGNEVSLVIEKPVDISAVDHALWNSKAAEPLDRLERADSWFLRLMKRNGQGSQGPRYQAVRVLDSYYEYRPLLDRSDHDG